MNTLDALKKARELIKDPSNWTQRASARNSAGESRSPSSSSACCWCASGALEKVCNKFFIGPWDALSRFTKMQTVITFNDSHTHAEVLALFDKAIAAEESK